MNTRKMIAFGMSTLGAVLIGFIISLDAPTTEAWSIAVVGTLLLVLAPEVAK